MNVPGSAAPESTIKPMPTGMRIALTGIFSVVALFCGLTLADRVHTGIMLSLQKAQVSGIVTQKVSGQKKSGKTYFLSYTFKVGDVEYSRTRYFGLIRRKTEVRESVFKAIQDGASLPVTYVKRNPNYNVPLLETHESDYSFWLTLGFVVFGIVAINETRILVKNRMGRNPFGNDFS